MSCPICARPASPSYRPFCSRRCADIDLGKWLTGGYSLPEGVGEEEDETAPEKPSLPH
ncbi:DNA gyrase inhibitor YacG [Profundibacterium mesophilum]|uniref:DNA gyrase inhibitor YacG n=1 Tax=Profundibacterium mesophilum KAUST100406-0324 TaxID=1037889 RepID=A0A921NSE6_9RHOB|nr:DNA gyrase inhibitor YacG [Profundibacterium mesophilum]KAF0675649.1 DNA gyrase inhibitor YacG [Profundibacterium mesophilum KAUST100406-0324]